MGYIYIILYLLVIVVSCVKLENKSEKCLCGIIFLILFIVASFRGPDFGADYNTYIEIFKDDGYPMEVTFTVIRLFIKQCLSSEVIFLFIIYAFLGLILKYYAIIKISDFPIISVMIYLGYYCILQDLVQIRAAVATGLLLVSIEYIYSRELFKFLLISVIAILFHYSAVIMLPLYLLNPKHLDIKRAGLLLIGSFMVYFLEIDVIELLIKYIPIQYIQEKYDNYIYLQNLNVSMFNEINIFNKLFLFRICIILFFVSHYWKIYKYNRLFYLLIKIDIISVALFISLAKIPVFAYRLSEFLGIVEIILYPLIIYSIKPRIFAIIFLNIYSLLCFYVQVFFNKIIKIQ